jgi:cyclomaltodextrinase / maltogenic alpha-amylase / neopullulanase
VPVDFWESARASLDQPSPGLLMLAEAHEPPLMRKAFDLDYAWPLHSALSEIFSQGKPARNLRAAWEDERAQYPAGALHLRISDDHDEERAIARFSKGGALAASALMFTLDGVPLLYQGMEAGDTTESGAPALFYKLPVFWQIAERRPEFRQFYSAVIALRHAHPALQQGETKWLPNSDDSRIVTFLRQGAGETFLVAINFSNQPFTGRVEAGQGFVEILARPVTSQSTPPPSISLAAWGFRIWRQK